MHSVLQGTMRLKTVFYDRQRSEYTPLRQVSKASIRPAKLRHTQLHGRLSELRP